MKERAEVLSAEWKDERDGYASLSIMDLAYISLPKGHPDIKKEYTDKEFWKLEVNGGLTFKEDNIFGWDYKHYQNDWSMVKHIDNAITFFKARGKKIKNKIKNNERGLNENEKN